MVLPLQQEGERARGEGEFLQSPLWERVLRREGVKTRRIGGVLFVEHRLPIVGKYLYSPGANRQATNDKRQTEEILSFAKKNGAGWIRMDARDEESLTIFRGMLRSIKKAPHNMQPRENFVIDISKSEDELLSEMKPKTRYNIKLSQKRGVLVRKQPTANKQLTTTFYQLVQETSRRAGITPHPRKHYEAIISALPKETVSLYTAEYSGNIIAANIVIFYGDTAIYLHGASSDEHREVMAPFLLQWRAIQDAKARGYRYYNFGGIASAIADIRGQVADRREKDTEKWGGITKFKMGFSPRTRPIVSAGSYDIIISSWKYALYRALQKVKQIV